MSAPVLINRYAHAFIDAARAKGYDDQSIRNCAGLTALPGSLSEPVYGPLTLRHLSSGVKLLMRDEFFGALKSPCKPGAFQMMCELAVESTTLDQALRRSFRFYALLCDEVRFELRPESGTRVGVSIWMDEAASEESQFFLEWYVVVWRGIASWLIGEKIPMLSARFTHAPLAPPSEYRAAYSDHCHFAAEVAGFTFDAKYLARPVIRNLADVDKLLIPTPIDLISVVEGGTLNSRLYRLLLAQLQEKRRLLSMEEVAGRYHMSTQTLRRRLEQEESSFRGVKEEARRAYVMQLLGNVDIPLGHVSEMSGYAESTELTRAVKTWTGLSPRAYRNKILGSRTGRR